MRVLLYLLIGLVLLELWRLDKEFVKHVSLALLIGSLVSHFLNGRRS